MSNAVASVLLVAFLSAAPPPGRPAQPQSAKSLPPPPVTVTSVVLDEAPSALEITLRNEDSRMIVAWTIDVQVTDGAGKSHTLHLGVDSWEDAAGLPGTRQDRLRVIRPADTLSYTVRVSLSGTRSRPVAVGEARVTSAIAKDGTPFGDPEMVRVMFMSRVREARQLDALAALLQEADSQAETPDQAVRNAIGHLDADSSLGSWRTTARSRLQIALRRSDTERTNPRDDLKALIRHTRAQAAAVRQVTPPTFFDAPITEARP